MTTPPARISVWVGEQLACIKIVGRANFTSSIDFKALFDELLQRGCRCFVLDLSECVLMDSTFLGVLAGFGLKLSNGNGGQPQKGIELLNPSARINELLDTLGVLHLFKTIQGTFSPPVESQPIDRAPANPSKAELSRTCIEAHQTLMDISPANVPKFKDVTQLLGAPEPNSQSLRNAGALPAGWDPATG
jgi:anti-sigma B factor antagonist